MLGGHFGGSAKFLDCQLLFDMLEICLLLLISLALRSLGPDLIGQSVSKKLGSVWAASAQCFWCGGIAGKWPPLHRFWLAPRQPLPAPAEAPSVGQRDTGPWRLASLAPPALSWQPRQ